MSPPPTSRIADAVRSVASDPSAVSALSVESRVIIASLQDAIQYASGRSLADVAASLTDVASNVIGESVGQAISAVADGMPLIGTVFKVFSMVVSGFQATSQDVKDQHCAESEAQSIPVPTGQGNATMPCDLFSTYDNEDRAYLGLSGAGSGPRNRPTIGYTLMQLTERYAAGPISPIGLAEAAAKAKAQIFHLPSPPEMGVPKKRRDLFTKLRVAIQEQRKHTPRLSTDGGATLWPIYLDLLQAEYDANHINESFALIELGMTVNTNVDPWQLEPFCFGTAQSRYTSVVRLLSSWRTVTHPWYKGADADTAQALSIVKNVLLQQPALAPKKTVSAPVLFYSEASASPLKPLLIGGAVVAVGVGAALAIRRRRRA